MTSNGQALREKTSSWGFIWSDGADFKNLLLKEALFGFWNTTLLELLKIWRLTGVEPGIAALEGNRTDF